MGITSPWFSSFHPGDNQRIRWILALRFTPLELQKWRLAVLCSQPTWPQCPSLAATQRDSPASVGAAFRWLRGVMARLAVEMAATKKSAGQIINNFYSMFDSHIYRILSSPKDTSFWCRHLLAANKRLSSRCLWRWQKSFQNKAFPPKTLAWPTAVLQKPKEGEELE